MPSTRKQHAAQKGKADKPRKAKAPRKRKPTARKGKPRKAAAKRKQNGRPKGKPTKAAAKRKPTGKPKKAKQPARKKKNGRKATSTKRAGRTSTRGRKVLRKRNSTAEAAAEMFEQFHGTQSTGSRRIRQEIEFPDKLAELGKLRRIDIFTATGEAVELDFTGPVLLCCEPTGRSLYIIGGNQAVPLEDLPLGPAADREKDHVYLGEAAFIVYDTRKAFHNFEQTEYGHEFGEDDGELPQLNYDRKSRLLYLTGGSYEVKPEGIVN